MADPPRLPFGRPVQLAYVVGDPAAAAASWERDLGAGPFTIAEHIPVDDVVHRGRPSTFDHTSAYGWWGDVMIELFCQHDDSPSAVTERFARGTGGLHHVACFVPDLDAALAAAGDAVAMTARAGTTRFAFVDAVRDLGHYWELYEPSERLVGFYAEVRRRHEQRT
jgi:hypothetical protein